MPGVDTGCQAGRHWVYASRRVCDSMCVLLLAYLFNVDAPEQHVDKCKFNAPPSGTPTDVYQTKPYHTIPYQLHTSPMHAATPHQSSIICSYARPHTRLRSLCVHVPFTPACASYLHSLRPDTYACPQCLPSDTVPIQSRTWTLQQLAILHRLLPYHTIPWVCYRRPHHTILYYTILYQTRPDQTTSLGNLHVRACTCMCLCLLLGCRHGVRAVSQRIVSVVR